MQFNRFLHPNKHLQKKCIISCKIVWGSVPSDIGRFEDSKSSFQAKYTIPENNLYYLNVKLGEGLLSKTFSISITS